MVWRRIFLYILLLYFKDIALRLSYEETDAVGRPSGKDVDV